MTMMHAVAYDLPSGGRLLVFKSRSPLRKEKWQFRLVAANGEPVGRNEGYTDEYKAKQAGMDLAIGRFGRAVVASTELEAAYKIAGRPVKR